MCKLSTLAEAYLATQKAANTIRAYSADWNDFAAWCAVHNISPLPATAADVANYLADISEHVCANTAARHLTAISIKHKTCGYSKNNPADNGTVKTIMYSIKREHGTAQRGKAPITPELLSRFRFGKSLIDLRDKALILLGFAGAFRRSELAAIEVTDVAFCGDGVTITIERSKTDPYGQGQSVAIPYNNAAPELCPVRALAAWLKASKIKSGYVFRSFWRGSNVIKSGKMTDRAVALIVKKYVEAAGLDPDLYSGHSLRRGFATAAARADVGTVGIMRQTRHKSVEMVTRYIAQGNAFNHNALNQIYAM